MKSVSISLFAVSITLAALGIASAAPMTMQAVTPDGESLKLQSVPTPAPAAGEVLIKVRAAAANPVDWRVFKGPPPGAVGGPPGMGPGGPRSNGNPLNIPGFDISGVIDAIGADVSGWKVGDEVIGFLDARGGYAQYAVAPITAIVAKPKNISFEEAAGIPTVAFAAWATIVDVAHVSKGQHVLIHGAAGGVGSAAVQIAKARGAYVIGTASARNHDYLRSIGADQTIDYTTEHFEDTLKNLDIVMNTADVDTANRSIGIVKKGGMLVTVAGRPDAAKCEAAGIQCASRSMQGATPIGQVLAQIAELVKAGKYQVNVDKTFPLADASKAWELGREGHTRGKLIITMPN